MNSLQVNPAFLVAQAAASLLNVVFPVVAAIVLQRKLRQRFVYVLYGALIFAAFQLFTRVPVVFVLQAVLQQQLQQSRPLQIAWLIGLSLTAALFEETGRWIGYRVLMRKEEKTWDKGVLYGVGHGGIEAMLLVGALGFLTVLNLTALSVADAGALPLTPEQRALAAGQIAGINALPPWFPLLSTYERLWAMAFHVGASILVLQCFRGGGVKWLIAAMALHFATNLFGTGLPLVVQLDRVPMALAQEGIITLFGLFGLWLAVRLRARAPSGPAPAAG